MSPAIGTRVATVLPESVEPVVVTLPLAPAMILGARHTHSPAERALPAAGYSPWPCASPPSRTVCPTPPPARSAGVSSSTHPWRSKWTGASSRLKTSKSATFPRTCAPWWKWPGVWPTTPTVTDDAYQGRRLRRWAHALGLCSYFLTKSRPYSTTCSALRAARQVHQRARRLQRRGVVMDAGALLVVSEWSFAGRRWRSRAERFYVTQAGRRIEEARRLSHEASLISGAGSP